MYGIWIGNSLDHAKVEASIELDKTVILEQDRAICLRKEELEEIFPKAFKRHLELERLSNILHVIIKKIID